MNETVEVYAMPSKRFLACAIDLALGYIFLFAPPILSATSGASSANQLSALRNGDLLMNIFVVCNWIVFVSVRGQSIGMAMIGISLKNSDMSRASFVTVISRAIAEAFACCLSLGYGYYVMCKNDKHQGWHDKITSTVVVDDDRKAISAASAILITFLCIGVVIGGKQYVSSDASIITPPQDLVSDNRALASVSTPTWPSLISATATVDFSSEYVQYVNPYFILTDCEARATSNGFRIRGRILNTTQIRFTDVELVAQCGTHYETIKIRRISPGRAALFSFEARNVDIQSIRTSTLSFATAYYSYDYQ